MNPTGSAGTLSPTVHELMKLYRMDLTEEERAWVRKRLTPVIFGGPVKRQVSETIHGKGAEEFARQRKHGLFEWNDDRQKGNHEIASPWATWTVEEVDGGWAVFVEEEL